jgi:hypothetical protein
MDIKIVVKEDENFKIVTGETVELPPIVEQPIREEKVQPTLESPKGHSWFNGTSWGVN